MSSTNKVAGSIFEGGVTKAVFFSSVCRCTCCVKTKSLEQGGGGNLHGRGSLVKEQGDGAALYGHIIRLARRENAQTRCEDAIQIMLLGLFRGN